MRVLVTGATGKTGRDTVDRLIERGIKVRALVHKMDDRAESLRAKGAEVVVGDLLDFESVQHAVEGVTSAYFVFPIAPGLIEATAFFAQAARDAGLSAIVNMSQISAREDSLSHSACNHWIAERVFDWAGISVTHLRPTFFAQWITSFPGSLRRLVEQGVISLPFADGRHAPIAAEDQARVIATILADPAGHAGKIYKLFGPVEMDEADIAAAVGEVLGRPIRYEPISIEAFRRRLETESGLPPFFIQHLCAVAQDYRDGLFAGSDDFIERLTGTAPMTVQQFVKSHLGLFTGASK